MGLKIEIAPASLRLGCSYPARPFRRPQCRAWGDRRRRTLVAEASQIARLRAGACDHRGPAQAWHREAARRLPRSS